MLADTFNDFMSAADLKLTERQRDALVKTLALFEGGTVRHVHENEYDGWATAEEDEETGESVEASFSGLFSMMVWGVDDVPYSCGTVACIGGTAELVGNVDFGDWPCHPALKHLFAPEMDLVGSWDDITVERATKALRGFLTTGTADWSEEE